MSFEDFSSRLLEKTRGKRIPWGVSIELTARCNLRCAHCYISRSPEDEGARASELTTSELCRLLDELVEEGCMGILFTGGESLIRSDFLDVYTYAKKKGLFVNLFTNGTTITPEIADYLAEWPPRSVEITLYGRTKKTYEHVTGVKGSHARCLRGIELLKERQLPLKLKTMVSTLNKHELPDMKAFAAENGLDFRFDFNLNKRLDRGLEPTLYRLTPEEAVDLDKTDGLRLEALREYSTRRFGPPAFPENLYWCGAGLSGFHVDPCGKVSLCINSREPSYDFRGGSVKEAWHEFIPRALSRKRKKTTTCQTCRLRQLCDQCPGWAQLENGNEELPVDYLCRIAHLRAQALGLEP